MDREGMNWACVPEIRNAHDTLQPQRGSKHQSNMPEQDNTESEDDVIESSGISISRRDEIRLIGIHARSRYMNDTCLPMSDHEERSIMPIAIRQQPRKTNTRQHSLYKRVLDIAASDVVIDKETLNTYVETKNMPEGWRTIDIETMDIISVRAFIGKS